MMVREVYRENGSTFRCISVVALNLKRCIYLDVLGIAAQFILTQRFVEKWGEELTNNCGLSKKKDTRFGH